MFRLPGMGRGLPVSGRGRGRSRGGFGVYMLVMQLMQIGLENIPSVTLALIALQSYIFINPADMHIPSLQEACISANMILRRGQWYRLFLSAFLHGDDYHLYYNMSSLAWKGLILEPRYGPVRYAATIAALVVLSGAFYVVLVSVLVAIYGPYAPLVGPDCAVGFSGVLFGMKVLLAKEDPGGSSRVFGFTMSHHYVFWVELVLIQVITPNVSFLGHLAGILAGLLLSSGVLESPLHSLCGIFSSVPIRPSEPRAHRVAGPPRTSGYRAPSMPRGSTSHPDEGTSGESRCIFPGCNYRAETGDELNEHVHRVHLDDDDGGRARRMNSPDPTGRNNYTESESYTEEAGPHSETELHHTIDDVRAARLARFQKKKR
eukprot:comp4797_c0_seq1/m.933 comp4797_c0_seq1/g.933  ORF comp4797_c0_seq1/g.933 comp4797_c0_seq1/m.933 type:complete len:374 (-) comp4797_c0_seq1:271-1392(-)